MQRVRQAESAIAKAARDGKRRESRPIGGAAEHIVYLVGFRNRFLVLFQ